MAEKKPDRHKTKPFQLRLHPVLKKQLETLAEQKLTTVTAELIEAARKHLADNGLWPVTPDKK